MHGINKAIQICRGCYEKAANQVDVGKSRRRVVVPKGHYLNKFRNDTDSWWLEEGKKCPIG